jgi:hypothetical protein
MEKIDKKIMLDDDFFQEIEIAERELLDDYVHGGMTAEEVDLFRRNFLKTDSRRDGLQFAEALQHKIGATPAPVPEPSPIFWSRPALALSVAILLALGLGSVDAYLAISLKKSQDDVMRLSRQLEEYRRREAAATQQGTDNRQLAGLGSFRIAYFSKYDVKGGGGLPEVPLAPEDSGVQFVLKMPAGLKSEVAVKLLDDAGNLITRASGLVPTDLGKEHVLIATFPAKYFQQANYVLELETDERRPHGADVDRSRYSFTIRSPQPR